MSPSGDWDMEASESLNWEAKVNDGPPSCSCPDLNWPVQTLFLLPGFCGAVVHGWLSAWHTKDVCLAFLSEKALEVGNVLVQLRK